MKLSWAERAALLVTAAVVVLCAARSLQSGADAGGYTVTGLRSETALPSPSARVFTPDAPLDLNAAGLEDLMGLPGVGQVRAQAILDYRVRHGAFASPEALMEVPGIGPGTYEALAPYITVAAEGGAKP